MRPENYGALLRGEKMGMRLAAVFGAITVSACASAAPPHAVDQTRTATIVATVGQSEWCPAGNVRVDLASGKYAFTARASRTVCQDLGLERPVIEGRLSAAQQRSLDQAFQRAITDGLNDCGGGRRPDDVIVSNGGTFVLVVANGRIMDTAPTELSCWTEAAWTLHYLLDATFPSPR